MGGSRAASISRCRRSAWVSRPGRVFVGRMEATPINRVREVLRQFDSPAQVWITETGYSTWRHDERRQLTAFVDALEAPVDRVYWFAAHDLDPATAHRPTASTPTNGISFRSQAGRRLGKAPLPALGRGGIDAVRDAYWIGKSARLSGGREAGADHRRLRIHRHQSGAPAALQRPIGAAVRQPLPARRRAEPGVAPSDARRPDADRGRRCAGPARAAWGRQHGRARFFISPHR